MFYIIFLFIERDFFFSYQLNDTLYVPIPVNIETVNTFYNQNIQDEAHMREFMSAIQVNNINFFLLKLIFFFFFLFFCLL